MPTPALTMVDLKERFFALVSPPLPTDWEVEENLDSLRALPPQRQSLILQQIPAIWPVSNSLCYSYLACAGTALECFSDSQISDWVSAILDTYEQQGLRGAQNFMADAEGNYLCRLRGETGVELDSLPHLQTYAQALAGRPLRLAPSQELGTDTETIFLPAKLAAFASRAENFLYYKLLLTLQAGLIKIGTYQLLLRADDPLVHSLLTVNPAAAALPEEIGLSDFFKLFPNPRLAEEIFTLTEVRRLLTWLSTTLPGLWRDGQAILQRLSESTEMRGLSGGAAPSIADLRGLVMAAGPSSSLPSGTDPSQDIIKLFISPALTVMDSATKTATIYAQLATTSQPHQASIPLPWLGRLQPDAAWQVRLRQRQEAKAKFIKGLAVIMAAALPGGQADESQESLKQPPRSQQSTATALLLAQGNKAPVPLESPTTPTLQRLVTLESIVTEIPETLRELGQEITNDLGQIPAEYVSAAQGLSGHGPLATTASAAASGNSLIQQLTYAEWDFRRHGYRKDWCAVKEKIIPPVKSNFIEATITKYRGQVSQLRKQFEMLRVGERFVGRQRDGNDFDLDAVIESLSDRWAGKAGSDQLFIRLRRDRRDIAVFFLVDMSSSTEGWVNLALKEALILTGEALQSIGDRFAIAGFSGMRRTRCDFFRVKDFAEPYNAEVKGRICAMTPREYTRMGPALRHATQLLEKVEARVRLLFVLSDGKPEDYDDYKGKYAIEDTRHALIEAKAVGIHPFCLTIDRQAHDYMPHMYGEVNYVFLDDVRKLPLRMPAIYRNLTSCG